MIWQLVRAPIRLERVVGLRLIRAWIVGVEELVSVAIGDRTAVGPNSRLLRAEVRGVEDTVTITVAVTITVTLTVAVWA